MSVKKLDNGKFLIEYKGKRVITKHYKEIPDNVFKQLVNDFYRKPDIEEVKRELYNIFFKNGNKATKVTQYFFKDLIAKVKVKDSYWTIEDTFQSKEIMSIFYAKIFTNEKVFPKTDSLLRRIIKAIEVGGKGYVRKPTNFSLKVAKEILRKYAKNKNYVDTSCGWGIRLLASLSNNLNYFGIEPNYLLVERLNKLYKVCKEVYPLCPNAVIKCQGSEIFIPEWENKMGIAFTSPPYFDLEDYKIGNQSTKLYPTYESWKNNFLAKTIENSYRYLTNNSYMLINIKNHKNYNLENDTIEIAKECGFKYMGYLPYNNITRCHPTEKFIDNSEKIFVFKKF